MSSSLSAENVLDLWERGEACPPVARGLAILASASEDPAPQQFSIGECEDRLLALHEATFGRRLNGYAQCPSCGERLELALDIPGLRAAVPEPAPSEALRYQGYEVRFRALTGADLMAAAHCASVSLARSALLERAIVAAVRRGRAVRSSQLPRAVVERLAHRLAECDPWAESVLNLSCPDCLHEWSVVLDVSIFVWTAIRARAQRLLHDVHALARAYGWRESDILAMSNRRREAYLELVGA